jgi:hypothetical protein
MNKTATAKNAQRTPEETALKTMTALSSTKPVDAWDPTRALRTKLAWIYEIVVARQKADGRRISYDVVYPAYVW